MSDLTRRNSLANALMRKVSQTKDKMAKEKAEEDAITRKREARDKMHALREKLDGDVDKNGLLEQLKAQDEGLAKAMAEDEDLQKQKMEQRRALLRARRKNKQNQEQEDARIKDKVDMIEEEQIERQAISEEYLRKMFKRSADADGEETKEEKQKRLDLLNEYLQDQFLERLSGLLTKQFTEKEQMLKSLLSKYMDARLAETAAIKANFKLD